jgi:hypothetical protein
VENDDRIEDRDCVLRGYWHPEQLLDRRKQGLMLKSDSLPRITMDSVLD